MRLCRRAQVGTGTSTTPNSTGPRGVPGAARRQQAVLAKPESVWRVAIIAYLPHQVLCCEGMRPCPCLTPPRLGVGLCEGHDSLPSRCQYR